MHSEEFIHLHGLFLKSMKISDRKADDAYNRGISKCIEILRDFYQDQKRKD